MVSNRGAYLVEELKQAASQTLNHVDSTGNSVQYLLKMFA